MYLKVYVDNSELILSTSKKKSVELGTLSQHGWGVNFSDQIILYLFGIWGPRVGR